MYKQCILQINQPVMNSVNKWHYEKLKELCSKQTIPMGNIYEQKNKQN